MSRHPPGLVVLHWLLALMIIGMLLMGFAGFGTMPPTDPAVPTLLRWHVSIGLAILLLMAARFAIRQRAALRRSRVRGGAHGPGLSMLQGAFYLLVPTMAATGLAALTAYGLLGRAFEGRAALPAALITHPASVAHALAATLLANLILLHGLFALYRHFVRKERILDRMSLQIRRRPRSA